MQNAARFIFLFFLLLSASFCFAQTGAPEATASISGRVTIDGNPARGITVQARPYLNNPQRLTNLFPGAISLSLPQTTTNADGFFRLTDLPSGRYIVMPSMPAMVGSYKDNNSMQRGLITLKEGAAIENIDFTLTRGGVITGRVTYEDGSPVIGAEISYTPEPIKDLSKPQFFFSTLRLELVKTDDRGIYRIYGLPEGRYNISLTLSRRFPQTVFYPGTADYTKAIG